MNPSDIGDGNLCQCGHALDDHDVRGNNECPACACGHEDDDGVEHEPVADFDAGIEREGLRMRVLCLARASGVSVEAILAGLQADLEVG